MTDLGLPISPAWYMSSTGRPWQLRDNKTWYFNNIPMTQSEAHEASPFTRLDERYITASEALDRAAEVLHEEVAADIPLKDGNIDRALESIKPEFDELYHE